jgi:uncharacterized protein (TIGR02300 family)
MTKPELGTKRLCANCSARYYDLNKIPVTCPKCGASVEAVAPTTRTRFGQRAVVGQSEVEAEGALRDRADVTRRNREQGP